MSLEDSSSDSDGGDGGDNGGTDREGIGEKEVVVQVMKDGSDSSGGEKEEKGGNVTVWCQGWRCKWWQRREGEDVKKYVFHMCNVINIAPHQQIMFNRHTLAWVQVLNRYNP